MTVQNEDVKPNHQDPQRPAVTIIATSTSSQVKDNILGNTVATAGQGISKVADAEARLVKRLLI